MARLEGGTITGEGRALLPRRVEQRSGMLRQSAACLDDYRRPEKVEHSMGELAWQRVCGLASGYEDLNDHDQLGAEPLMAPLSGNADLEGEQPRRQQDCGKVGAGKSTLNRLKLTTIETDPTVRYKKIVMNQKAVDNLLVDLYLPSPWAYGPTYRRPEPQQHEDALRHLEYDRHFQHHRGSTGQQRRVVNGAVLSHG